MERCRPPGCCGLCDTYLRERLRSRPSGAGSRRRRARLKRTRRKEPAPAYSRHFRNHSCRLPGIVASLSNPPPASSSILPYLSSAEYPIDLSPTGTIRLADGHFEGQLSPGSAAWLTVSIGDAIAAGDLNEDGVDDAALVLIADPGGSGTFSYLAAVRNEGGAPRAVASALLGDRVAVKSLAIRAGMIEVTLLSRDPGDPLASPPTLEKARVFALQNGQLVQQQEPGGVGGPSTRLAGRPTTRRVQPGALHRATRGVAGRSPGRGRWAAPPPQMDAR